MCAQKICVEVCGKMHTRTHMDRQTICTHTNTFLSQGPHMGRFWRGQTSPHPSQGCSATHMATAGIRLSLFVSRLETKHFTSTQPHIVCRSFGDSPIHWLSLIEATESQKFRLKLRLSKLDLFYVSIQKSLQKAFGKGRQNLEGDWANYLSVPVFPKLRVGTQNGWPTSFHCVANWQNRMHNNTDMWTHFPN